MGRTNRSSPAYRAAAARFKAGRYPCHLELGPACTGHGTTVDHCPPIGDMDERTWFARGGVLLPACRPCQDRQGGKLAHSHPYATTRWQW